MFDNEKYEKMLVENQEQAFLYLKQCFDESPNDSEIISIMFRDSLKIMQACFPDVFNGEVFDNAELQAKK